MNMKIKSNNSLKKMIPIKIPSIHNLIKFYTKKLKFKKQKENWNKYIYFKQEIKLFKS